MLELRLCWVKGWEFILATESSTENMAHKSLIGEGKDLLTSATFPYVKLLADKSFWQAVIADLSLAKGVMCYKKCLTHEHSAKKKLRKRNVLFVGPYPPPYSGPDIQMKTLLESSLAERFNISFLNTNIRESNAQRGKFDLIMVIAFFFFIFRLLFMMVVKRPLLVYYFVTATRLGWLGRDIWCIFIARLFGAKVVIHMRAGHFRHNFETFNTIEKKIVKAACSLVSLGLVQAKNLRNQFQGLLEEDKIVEVYNAVDTGKYYNDTLYDYNPNMILFLGHLSYAKGYLDILKILPNIAQEYPDIRFYFAGTKIKYEKNVCRNQMTGQPIVFEDPDECYEKYIQQKYDKNYAYLQVVGEQEKMALLRKCNFLILPSYSEGFSVAVLEAMSMGKPVICTAVGAHGEIIKDGVNGFLSSPGDRGQLAKNILTLLSDEELRNRIATTNRLYVLENFDINKVAKQLGDHFDKLLSS